MRLKQFFKVFFHHPDYGKTPVVAKDNVVQQCNTEICNTLHFNLMQLEFINCLEQHLDKRKEKDYALEFLLELKALKFSVQQNTINSIRYCKS